MCRSPLLWKTCLAMPQDDFGIALLSALYQRQVNRRAVSRSSKRHGIDAPSQEQAFAVGADLPVAMVKQIPDDSPGQKTLPEPRKQLEMGDEQDAVAERDMVLPVFTGLATSCPSASSSTVKSPSASESPVTAERPTRQGSPGLAHHRSGRSRRAGSAKASRMAK